MARPWLPRAWAGATFGDVIAGATVAATSLPQYIAYAELAGLPGLAGVRTSGPPLLAVALLTRSPVLSVGVTSITAIMAHSALRGSEYREARGDEAWADLLGAFAVLVGVASFVLSACGVWRLVAFIPGPVKTGWKLGFAVTVVASQAADAVFGRGKKVVNAQCPLPSLPSPLGGGPVPGGSARMYRLSWMLLHPHQWDVAAVALTGLSLAIVLRGGPLLARLMRVASLGRMQKPIAGLEVIAACVAGTLLAAAFGYSGAVVGAPAAGGSAWGSAAPASALAGVLRRWPSEMPWSELVDRLGGWPSAVASAMAFAAVDFLAIVSIVDAGAPLWRELAGQGLGCVVSGMCGSAPVGGSLSRSLVAKMTGASSPAAGFVCGLVTLALAAPSVSALLAPMPKALLAAVVLAAVLPGVVHPKDMLAMAGIEALLAWSTTLACALTDPTKGFAVGVALSALLWPLRRRADAAKMA